MIHTIKEKLYPSYKLIKRFLLFPLEMHRYHKLQQMNPVRQNFAQSLSFFQTENNSDQLILVQKVRDYEYAVKLAAASKVIAQQYNANVNLYDVNWMKHIGWNSNYQNFYHLFNKKSANEKIFESFGNRVLFRCEDLYSDQQLIKVKFQEIKSQLNRPEDILEIRFEGILVGDLLYDTYLRYFHQPTIEEINPQVLQIIKIGLNIFYNFSDFLRKHPIKALVNTYSSYIEHGLTTRICLKEKIPVYTVGSYSYVLQKLSEDFPYHQINHTKFSPDKMLDEGQLARARDLFVTRFEGKIDSATSYMRQSAFGLQPLDPKVEQLFKKRQRNVVIYIHDFYDSPHVNRKLLFPDLYQYLKQTLEALVDLKDTTVFIKIHPNGIAGCKEKAIELLESFQLNHFQVLPDQVTNNHIIELKPDLIATARGTICLEMAYVGIPTVALFDNLYANFPFTHTCSDRESYFEILKGQRQPNNVFQKEHVYSFYYQAFLEKTTQENQEIFSILAAKKGATSDDTYLAYLLNSTYPEMRQNLLEEYETALKQIG